MHTNDSLLAQCWSAIGNEITWVPYLANCGKVLLKDNKIQVHLMIVPVCLLESHGGSKPRGRVGCRLALMFSDEAPCK